MFILIILLMLLLGICLWIGLLKDKEHRLDIKNYHFLKVAELQILWNHFNSKYLQMDKLYQEETDIKKRTLHWAARNIYLDARNSVEPFLLLAQEDRENNFRKK